MANEMVKLDEQGMSANVRDILKKNIETATEGIEFRPPKYTISHSGLTFLSSVGDEKKDTITGVIVLKQTTRGYWIKKEEGKDDKAPDCASLNGMVGTQKLVEEVRLCATCPNNKWGSIKGSGKACKEMRRIMIVENTDDYFPVILTLPPTSIKIFDEFLSGLYQKKKHEIMTNIKFSLDRAEGGGFKYAKIKLELGEPLTMAQIDKVGAIQSMFKKKFEALDIEEEEQTKDKPDEFYDPLDEHLPV